MKKRTLRTTTMTTKGKNKNLKTNLMRKIHKRNIRKTRRTCKTWMKNMKTTQKITAMRKPNKKKKKSKKFMFQKNTLNLLYKKLKLALP